MCRFEDEAASAEGDPERFLLVFLCLEEPDFALILSLVLLLLCSCLRLLGSDLDLDTGDLLGEWALELPREGGGERESSLDKESLLLLRLELLDLDESFFLFNLLMQRATKHK